MLRPRDTSPSAAERQREALRAMTPGERLSIAAAMSDEIRTLAEAGLRARHPTYEDGDVARELARILLGPDLAERVVRTRGTSTR